MGFFIPSETTEKLIKSFKMLFRDIWEQKFMKFSNKTSTVETSLTLEIIMNECHCALQAIFTGSDIPNGIIFLMNSATAWAVVL